MYSKILVATDASAHARKAVATACRLASNLDAQLVVAHVMGEGEVPEKVRALIDAEHLADPPQIEIRSATDLGSGLGYLRTIGETGIRRHQMWEALARHVMNDARSLAVEHGAGDIDCRIEQGRPVSALMALVDEISPDLVVMGRRGVSDLQGLLVGSVSHRISHLVSCDVLTTMAY